LLQITPEYRKPIFDTHIVVPATVGICKKSRTRANKPSSTVCSSLYDLGLSKIDAYCFLDGAVGVEGQSAVFAGDTELKPGLTRSDVLFD
jgi:hypothetical protein